MELKKIIIDFKKKTKMTNLQIAEKIGVAHTTVGRWVRGEVTNIHGETAEQLSKLLGVNVRTLLDGEVISLTKPILGTVKAGYDLFLQDNYLGEETVCEEEYHKGDYFLKVVGNSMEPSGIVDGGLVYVKQTSIMNINSKKTVPGTVSFIKSSIFAYIASSSSYVNKSAKSYIF